jgi:VWFA-related protein
MMRGTSDHGVPLVVLAALTLLAFRAVTAQQPPFTANTNLVVVPVVAVDHKGAIVEGLTQEHFQIFEDGKPVPIQTFAAPGESALTGDDGRFVVIALDNLLTSAELAYRLKNIAKMFVERLGPRDVMSIISINGGRATTTSSKSELLAAIDRFRPAVGEDTWTYAQKTNDRRLHKIEVKVARTGVTLRARRTRG